MFSCIENKSLPHSTYHNSLWNLYAGYLYFFKIVFFLSTGSNETHGNDEPWFWVCDNFNKKACTSISDIVIQWAWGSVCSPSQYQLNSSEKVKTCNIFVLILL